MDGTVVMIGTGLSTGSWEPLADIFRGFGRRCQIIRSHDDAPAKCELGLLVNYGRVVPPDVLDSADRGFILTHSSPLPKGRGSAPIYNTAKEERDLILSLLFAAPEVDAGNLIAQARYPLSHSEVEPELRRIDDLLTVRVLRESASALLSGRVVGQQQDHSKATWCERRRPAHSEIDPNQSIAAQFNHLRGLPVSAPAFFSFRGRKYFISMTPEQDLPIDPGRIEVQRFF